MDLKAGQLILGELGKEITCIGAGKAGHTLNPKGGRIYTLTGLEAGMDTQTGSSITLGKGGRINARLALISN